jgi:hypothetical protein
VAEKIVSVLIASISIGVVLGWAAVPRPSAAHGYWLGAFAGVSLALFGASRISPLLLSPALGAAGVAFALRALWIGSLKTRSLGKGR